MASEDTAVPGRGGRPDVERGLGKVAVLEPAVGGRPPARARRIVPADVEVPGPEGPREVEHERSRPDPADRDPPLGTAARAGRGSRGATRCRWPRRVAPQSPPPGGVGDVPEVGPSEQARRGGRRRRRRRHTRPGRRPPPPAGPRRAAGAARASWADRPVRSAPSGPPSPAARAIPHDTSIVTDSRDFGLPRRAAGSQPPTTRRRTPRDPEVGRARCRAA